MNKKSGVFLIIGMAALAFGAYSLNHLNSDFWSGAAYGVGIGALIVSIVLRKK